MKTLRGKIYFLFLILSGFSFLSAWDSSWLRLDGDASFNYNFSSTSENLTGFDSDFNFFIGLRTNVYSYGFELSGEFQSFSGSSLFSEGYSFDLGGYYKNYYSISPLVEWSWGLGTLWQHENIMSGEVLINDLIGPSFFYNIHFDLPFPYLSVGVTSKLDLLLMFNDLYQLEMMSPYFTGGVRFYYNPLPRKLGIYLDINTLLWSYDNRTVIINPWVFQAGAGIVFHLEPSEYIKRIRRNETKTAEVLNSIRNIDVIDAPPEIIALLRGQAGDQISFYIPFIRGDFSLSEAGGHILSAIGEILQMRKDIGVYISAYAESEGDMVKEFELAIKRAEVLRNWFIGYGVDPMAVKRGTSGNIAFSDETMVVTFEIFKISPAIGE